ncbi:unnamed protein product [Vitrella brassicaformis CCMP3155]|uniref:Uncharacterized protein n=2 Tax=Vitrella brassicaformis TaxID=1169539 RepID=A0A0G4ESP0_VITBC|nr:unnamed protein product [Vitrella brassicaformis CCMP3155]|mmetsp:Transcript_45665/g.113456  ORF Transcript_45665/g.113456 Transcript_45665/m.113456 type:complete len:283 (+) Transcript_45665:173-1021(+)|eukprot:CEM00891.1 unnamed protein product [Vitrella brassicaformis CCMP3155]
MATCANPIAPVEIVTEADLPSGLDGGQSLSSPPPSDLRCGDDEDFLDAEDDASTSSTVPMDMEKGHHSSGDVDDKSPEGFPPESTIFIFDWDDTLMPSTWLTQKSLRLDNDCVVSEDLQVHLDSMAECAKRTLELAASMGTVVIITNAEQGWIELSCRKFMPSLYDSVTQYRILSARSTFEPEGFQSPFEWKAKAFDREIGKFYSERSSVCRRNVISFGDSAHEREAILHVTSGMPNCRTKSLKFVERPEIAQLQKEHELIAGCLSQIVHHDAALDLCIKCS